MKQWLDAVDKTIKKWSIRDVALLKVCLCSAGVILGLGISRKHHNKAAFAASTIFSVTYVLVMLPFLQLLNQNREESGN